MDDVHHRINELLENKWHDAFDGVEQQDGTPTMMSQYGIEYVVFDGTQDIDHKNIGVDPAVDKSLYLHVLKENTDADIVAKAATAIDDMIRKVQIDIDIHKPCRMVMRTKPRVTWGKSFETGRHMVRASVRLHTVSTCENRIELFHDPDFKALSPTPIGVAPVKKYDRTTVVADLRQYADEIERGEHGDPGKFMLILLQDFECENARPNMYDVKYMRTRMYDREAALLADHVKTYLMMKMWGLTNKELQR